MRSHEEQAAQATDTADLPKMDAWLRAIQYQLYRGACCMGVYVISQLEPIMSQWGQSEMTVFFVCWALTTLMLLFAASRRKLYRAVQYQLYRSRQLLLSQFASGL
jgi:hypothetical protein